ncbi:PAP2-domain-containing protein [Tothia fuscella]|uniref:PAP2-domain-containing protein n=1 Tax=Tothia fuscella TaxID=1048955 RepID=A0A9P4NNN4_9PEZI|nr:PAP2-domain-containing protein [Tothia fuscella]
MRPFSLVDLSISYPLVASTVPNWLLVVVSLVGPGAIIFLVCLILVPGPTVNKQTPKSLIWRRKLWEWNTGWMGLGLSLALAFFFTQGMKNLFGKPRPDLLARCDPDLSLESIRANTVGGGYASELNPLWVLISPSICRRAINDPVLKDGFRSFPSGHASMSWSGLLYLSFFLCSKFAISVPFLPPRQYSQDESISGATLYSGRHTLPLHHDRSHSNSDNGTESANLKDLGRRSGEDTSPLVPIRNQAAAPPVYLIVLAMIPVCGAIYIVASRVFDFYHHGFDVIFGSLIGITSAWFSFRWYHLPVTRGAGWSWGARSRDRAFGIGLGRDTYVGQEGWSSKKADERVAANGNGHAILGPGLDGQGRGLAEEHELTQTHMQRGEARLPV